jgi:hypothetical protein
MEVLMVLMFADVSATAVATLSKPTFAFPAVVDIDARVEAINVMSLSIVAAGTVAAIQDFQLAMVAAFGTLLARVTFRSFPINKAWFASNAAVVK